MKGYDNYKVSGVEWIGEIPENWENVRLKLISSITKGRKPNKDYEDYFDGLVPYLSMEYLRDKTDEPIYAEANEKNLVIVDEGDILILWDGSKAGEIVRAKKGVLSSTMAKIAINDSRFESIFLNYLLQLGEKHIQANTIGMGIPHVNGNILKDLMMLLPTSEEQTKIASFLDYKTNLIDATIEKKKRLIELLKEKRQAVINEAVTKGLNPNAPMKDSGVAWLGEIPADWNVKKVKYLLNDENGIKIGPFGSALKLDTLSDKGIKVYGQGNVIKDDFNHGHRYIDIERFEKDFKQYEILNGDILITMMGTTGKSKVFNSSYEKGILDSHLLRLRFNENLFDGRLFSILLEQSDYVYQQLTLNSVGSIMAGLNSSIVKELSIITPTLEIQKEILNYIDENSKIIDSISSKILFQIEKLQTYRQSLISEAVTGKIDVRDWQA